MQCPYCHMPIPNEQRMAELDEVLASVQANRRKAGPMIGNEKQLESFRKGSPWYQNFALGARVWCKPEPFHAKSRASDIGTVIGYSRQYCWILKDDCIRAYPFNERGWRPVIEGDNFLAYRR